jgi:hypothetical protein
LRNGGRLESHPAEIVFVGNCAKLRLNEIAIGFSGSFQKTPDMRSASNGYI